MINGKYSYLLKIKTKEDSDKLSGLIKRITGKDVSKEIDEFISLIPNKPPICSGYVEISNDLLDFKNTTLNGFCSHIGYPANKNFISKLDEFIDKYENEWHPLKDYVIIKHFPHASLDLPNDSGITNYIDFKKYNLKMSDIGIDYLFKDIKGIEIKAPYSRIYCDVERYRNDKKEIMSKYGQGYIYSKYYDGKSISRYFSMEGNSSIVSINKYYDEHHKKLDNTVRNIFSDGKKALLLDIHSFSDELANSSGKTGPYPDICIGINDVYYDEKIVNLIIRKIKEKGYTYKINYPYSGSIIPQGIINGKLKGELCSIMLEINKRIYL